MKTTFTHNHLKQQHHQQQQQQHVTIKVKQYPETEMDPGIWSRLPGELLEQVLSFLPLKTFLNLRSTCKHFKSLVFSPNFVSKHASTSALSSFLLLSHKQFHCNNNFPLYDSVLGSWRNSSISLSLLLGSASPSSSSSSSPGGSISTATLLSSSNGLFCFSVPSSSSFLVSNFLTKTSKTIDFPSYPFVFEAFTFISTQSGYKIFLLCSNFSRRSAFVYDSDFQSWQEHGGFDPILSDNCHQEGVYFNGSLYFTTPEPFSVVGFDLERGKWETVSRELPGELTFARLVSDGKSKLYLIGGVGANGISRTMKIWELNNDNGGNLSWSEIESLPELVCRKFMSVCYHNYEHVYCFWHQDMICVCCSMWPEILYFKFSRRTWHWLPKCPSLPEKWSCGFRWFSFVPELYASV